MDKLLKLQQWKPRRSDPTLSRWELDHLLQAEELNEKAEFALGFRISALRTRFRGRVHIHIKHIGGKLYVRANREKPGKSVFLGAYPEETFPTDELIAKLALLS